MKLYISGPITGYPNKNREAFEEVAAVVKQLGHDPVTPFDLNVVEPVESTDWVANMKRDLKFVPTVDGFVMLDDWEKSKGACVEVAVAYFLEIPLYKLDDRGELIAEKAVATISIAKDAIYFY